MDELLDYLYRNFAIQIEAKQASKESTSRLPLYLKGNYTFYESELYGRPLLFAAVREEAEVTPERLAKQGNELRRIFKRPVVYVLADLASWDRKRLIERGVAFAQPGRQLFLPELLIDLGELRNTVQHVVKPDEPMTYAAQLAVLYHLQMISLEDLPLNTIAEKLNYSAMSVSRIVKELEQLQLIELSGTKEKRIRFLAQEPRSLWEQAMPLLRTPIRNVYYVNELPQQTLMSGDTALSQYTLISAGDQPSYAVAKVKLTTLPTAANHPRYGRYRLETWQYPPQLLGNAKTVDKLSLYLSLKESDDERIQIALNELLTQLWS
ncbi:helix-turn-helix domain-containing protein [Mucilaginibacter sp. PAMB04274]|uniref:MarR family transcriptional regulator n=1 Tax=Mucilaginibacter sp. PAMB04274 TaxID=3138568 RepID=UPI0031F63BA1